MEIIKTGWEFFQNQILGMQWLKDLIGKLLVKAGLGEGRFPGEFLHFFLYDIIKIFVLLAVLIFVISYIQSYFPPEKSRKIMGSFHGIWANLIGALLGTVTPFCSCSSIPIFMGFTSAGLPLGVTFSFLISSPMVDLGSLILLMSVFGGKIAFAYVIVGLVIAVIGGTIIEQLHMEDQVADFIRQAPNVEVASPSLTIADRMDYAKNQVVATVKKVAPYIVVGVIIGWGLNELTTVFRGRPKLCFQMGSTPDKELTEKEYRVKESPSEYGIEIFNVGEKPFILDSFEISYKKKLLVDCHIVFLLAMPFQSIRFLF